ncbi:MAG: saccharopine dehydrogenase family protein [Candidatus Bathyarchaeota archaeon]|nr:saccharopine dehydrogenase family protein [Candidatus Bathyarchaeota archaeon]
MKVLLIGCGNIGSIAAEDFARSLGSAEVSVADKKIARAKKVTERIGTDNVSWVQLDTSDYSGLVKTLGDFDLVMGFLPGSLGYHLVEACVDAGKDLVDVSYMDRNPLTLNEKAVKANTLVVPDCGLAPGISNILVGHALRRLDEVHTVHIMVGGFPETPMPPLGYAITWSPESLIDEYTRRARIVKDGRIINVEALGGLEEVDFPNVGRLEAFYTDGLRTLLHTVDKVDSMWEKTLRYPGHAEKVKLLKSLGLFNERRINVGDVSLSPRAIMVRLLEQKLGRSEVKDIVALKIGVSGAREGLQTRLEYTLLERYDERRGITAMARTTAYPASIIAQLILGKAIKEKGVVPPEKLGKNEKLFQTFVNELRKRKVEIIEEIID